MDSGSNFNILQLLISSLIGGSVAAVIIEVVFGFFQRKNERIFNFLKEQISLIYAPLYYLTMQNEIIQTNIEELSKAEIKVEKDIEGKTNNEIKDCDRIKEIKEYFNEIIHNNKKIKKILDNYCYLLDPSDFYVLKTFLDNYIRLTHDTNGKLDVNSLGEKLISTGNISLLDPELNEQIKKIFQEKQDKYKKLYR
jgi:hypothetical protein